MFALGKLPCTFYNFWREAAPLRNGERVRAARLADGKLVQRFQLCFVKCHSAVNDAGYFARHYFQVQVMRCYNTYSVFVRQRFYNCLRKSATKVWVRAAT